MEFSKLLFLFSFNLLCVFTIAQDTNNPRGLDKYTEEEFAKIKKLRSRVKDLATQDYMLDKTYLVRFLRARDLDINAAEKMIKENFAWRNKYNVDDIIKEDFSRWQTRYPFHFNVDKEGRSGLITSLKDLDIRRVILAGMTIDLGRYMLYALEKGIADLYKTSNATGKELVAGNVIVNMAGFNLRAHGCVACIRAAIEALLIYEGYYPRVIHRLIAINLPRSYQTLYQIAKPVISKHTQSILQIYGVDKEEWSKVLLKYYSKDQLPLQFGGTAPDKAWNNLWLSQIKNT